ncbi:MAG: DUF2628 domain-containing protein [Oscillospiraceae bacterium]|nr:DUF2628 domain-containing protein [Oscillospiraceae bacterium]
MNNYTGIKCPYCGKTFTDVDDIAVCPDCGTPHHRLCYLEHNACANADKHAAGFVFSMPSPEPQPGEFLTPNTAQSEIVSGYEQRRSSGTIYCSRCGKPNSAANRYCNFCGSPLVTPTNQYSDSTRGRTPFFSPADINAEQFDPNEKIDGIPIKDWMKYIGSNTYYYLYNFKTQDRTNRKIAFSFSAMLFPFFYFMYRRVYKFAFIAAIVNFILNFPALCQYYLIPSGISIPIPAGTLETLSTVASILSIVVSLLWGLFAVWIYRRNAVAKMTQLHMESGSEDEYNYKLSKIAGPTFKGVLILAAVYVGLLAISWLFSFV